MAWLFQSYPDPDRAYYGSDTHASALLVGAALALATALRRPTRGDRPPAPLRMTVNSPTWPLDAAALLGSVVVGYFLTHANYFSDGLYRGGFLARRDRISGDCPGGGPARHGDRAAARHATPVLDRCPVVRDLPMALAGFHAQPAAAGLSVGWRAAHGAARRVDGRARRPVVPVHRASDPNPGFRCLRPVRAGSFSPAPLRSDSAPDRLRGRARLGCRSGRGVASPGGRFRVRYPHERRASVAGRYAKSVGISDARCAAGASGSPFARPVHVTVFGDSQGMTLLLNKPAGLDGSLTLDRRHRRRMWLPARQDHQSSRAEPRPQRFLQYLGRSMAGHRGAHPSAARARRGRSLGCLRPEHWRHRNDVVRIRGLGRVLRAATRPGCELAHRRRRSGRPTRCSVLPADRRWRTDRAAGTGRRSAHPAPERAAARCRHEEPAASHPGQSAGSALHRSGHRHQHRLIAGMVCTTTSSALH